MILLDTNHLSVYWLADDRRNASLSVRLSAVNDQLLATTIITVEEVLRGWLAEINRLRDIDDQIPAYRRLAKAVERFGQWEVLPFDELAAGIFKKLRKQRIRVGTMDLKIASIALAQDALLLSANLKDFRCVPGLRVESWLD